MKKIENSPNRLEKLYLSHLQSFPDSLLSGYNLGYLGKTEQLISMFEDAGGRDICPIIQWDKNRTHTPIRSYFLYLEKGEKVRQKYYPITDNTFINYFDILRKGEFTYSIGYYKDTPSRHFLLYKEESEDLEHLFLTKDEIIQQEFKIYRKIYPRPPVLLYDDITNNDHPLVLIISNGKKEYEISLHRTL